MLRRCDGAPLCGRCSGHALRIARHREARWLWHICCGDKHVEVTVAQPSAGAGDSQLASLVGNAPCHNDTSCVARCVVSDMLCVTSLHCPDAINGMALGGPRPGIPVCLKRCGWHYRKLRRLLLLKCLQELQLLPGCAANALASLFSVLLRARRFDRGALRPASFCLCVHAHLLAACLVFASPRVWRYRKLQQLLLLRFLQELRPLPGCAADTLASLYSVLF